MAATITWNLSPFRALIRKEIRWRLELASQVTADHIKRTISKGRIWGGQGRSAHGPGLPPHVDTGALRQSIFWEIVTDTYSFMRSIVGTTKIYGIYLELGAYIRPKTAKMLCVPWSPEARNHNRRGGNSRTFPRQLIFVRTRFGGWLIEVSTRKTRSGRGRAGPVTVMPSGGSGISRPRHKTGMQSIRHYLLITHAHLKARPFLRPGLMTMIPRIRRIFRK